MSAEGVPGTDWERRRTPAARRNVARREVVTVVSVTAAVWLLGSQFVLLRPLTWLATLVHEASHALVATLLGLHVQTVTINSSGGGLTFTSGQRSTAATIAVGSAGYLGAAAVGGVMIELCRRLRHARVATAALAVLIALVLVAWVPWSFHPGAGAAVLTGSSSGDGRFTVLFCVLAIVVLVALTVQPSARLRRVMILVIATTLCLASVESLKVVTSISSMGGDSDASNVAAVTPLTSWMWSALWLVAGSAICLVSTWAAVGKDPSAAP